MIGAASQGVAVAVRSRQIVFVVGCGILGGYLGYWGGHLVGWSRDADWPLGIGGGWGAILLAIAASLVAAAAANSVVRRPFRPNRGAARSRHRPEVLDQERSPWSSQSRT